MNKKIYFMLFLVIMVIICAIDAKKHRNKKRDHNHSRHHHHRLHHKHSSEKSGKRKETEKKDDEKKGSGVAVGKNLREQVREFHERINKMLPRCKKNEKCPVGTCCWKGKCKMLPHRLNQRCSTTCPCNDPKKSMYCHVKRIGSKTSKYGRCYMKGKKLGMKSVNFIPETIEKLKDVEKKMMKEKSSDEKKKSKKMKRKKGGKKHHKRRD